MCTLLRSLIAVAVTLATLCATPARAQQPVDLELVLAVDVSLSMDFEEQRVQREGYVAALRDPLVWRAIEGGGSGRIAITYFEWAGALIQQTVLPWTLIDSKVALDAFADRLAKAPISRGRMTSISAALTYASQQLEESAFKGRRRVIDVSGDGPNNAGAFVADTRDELVKRGIIINGLPIMVKDGQPSGFFDIRNLDAYYRDCVIGGSGAFVIAVRSKEEFAPAIRRKLILEISGVSPPPEPEMPRIVPISDPPPGGVDCLIGERLWQRYMDGRSRE